MPTQDTPFVMHGSRAAIAGGMGHIEEQVKALEVAVGHNTGLVFDLAKTLIESTCRTIIKEKGKTFEKEDDLPKLFKTASSSISFLPTSLSSDPDARKSLLQTLNGMNTALQGICELRNSFGFASHGSSGPRPEMEKVHALLAAQAADAIVGFLYQTHLQEILRTRNSTELKDFAEFNEWIDERVEPVKILSLRVSAKNV